MTISSVRTRDFQKDDFTGDEVDAMRRDQSTSAVMNQVRHDIGIKGRDVAIRGDDKSNAELRKEWEAHDLKHAGVGSAGDIALQGFEHESAAHLGGIAIFAIHALTALSEAEERGEALKTNNERGAMHLAMLTAVDVPPGFKNVEVSKWRESGTADRSGAALMGTRLEAKDRRDAARLQLHVDRGMNAAASVIITGKDPRAALAADPALKARYDADPAFKLGFDSLVWAKEHDAAQYTKALENLHARDARYDQHHIVRC